MNSHTIIYSNSQTVVVQIATPISAPWLARTTYLLDQAGHTTGVLAQTDQPTAGVSLAPIPFSNQAQTALPSTTAPAKVPSLDSGTSQTPIPGATIAAAVIVAVTGIAIMVALVFYLRQRGNTNLLQMENQFQQLQFPSQTWRSVDRFPYGEGFLKEAEEYHEGLAKSTMTSIEVDRSGFGLKSSKVGYRHSISELRQQMQPNSPQSCQKGWQSSETFFAPSARYSLPQTAPARAQSDQPTSILKRPVPARTTNTIRSMNNNGEKTKPAVAKKGVRFGVNQIREFGRSPLIGYGG